MLDYRMSLGNSKRRGKGRVSGGKEGKGKGKGKDPASGEQGPASGGQGDSETSMSPMCSRYGKRNFDSRILSIRDDNSYHVWEGLVISLPFLLHRFGAKHTAADLYAYWCTLKNTIATGA